MRGDYHMNSLDVIKTIKQHTVEIEETKTILGEIKTSLNDLNKQIVDSLSVVEEIMEVL